MKTTGAKQLWLGALCGALILAFGVGAAPARGAASDPLFVLTPTPPPSPALAVPPPIGYLNGPCGLAVDSSGQILISDYYHDAIDFYSPNVNPSSPWSAYISQFPKVDPLDGPCGLALDSTNRLYVNNFHRNVVRFNASPSFGAGTTIAGAGVDNAHPTGVAVDGADNVYVDDRTYVTAYDLSGAQLMDGPSPLKIGLDPLADYYGVAVSQYVSTLGYVYVPDATTNTVKVFNPAVDKVNPVATIKDPFNKPFISLKDSAIAVDRFSGYVYFADNTQPLYAERPQAEIYVYDSTNTYQGHLKFNVIDALPVGLAIDNSTQPTQGRVYVTSGNTTGASVYAYGIGAPTFAAPLAPVGAAVRVGTSGSDGGAGQGEPPSTQSTPVVPDQAVVAGGMMPKATPMPTAKRTSNSHRRARHRHRRHRRRHVLHGSHT